MLGRRRERRLGGLKGMRHMMWSSRNHVQDRRGSISDLDHPLCLGKNKNIFTQAAIDYLRPVGLECVLYV